jgi:translocation and assembly module TamB
VVQGRASAPELRFASTPALPEDEVLPRLLFGQSRQSLSGPQAIQLAVGMATLFSGDAGPLDFALGATGLDVLRVEGETDEDASVTVGRNVGEGIFIGAQQRLDGQGGAVIVEVEVFDGVVVDSEVGQDGGGNIGITLRRDF